VTTTVSTMSMRRLSIALATFAATLVVIMLVITALTGATQEAHEYVVRPADYAASLLAAPTATRALFAVDLAFLVLYTVLFVALAAYLADRGAPRALLRLAVGAVAVIAALDIAENHHILSLLDLAEHGGVPSDAAMSLQQTISGAKFTISALALTCFGLCIPRDTKTGWLLSGFLVLGPLATTILNTAAPPDLRPDLDNGRWIGFLFGFAFTAVWLRGEPETKPAVKTL
jgi:hypothetical protein